MVAPHPAYEQIAKVEAAWSDDADQASARAHLVVYHLVHCGILTGGEWSGDVYVLRDGEPAAMPADAKFFGQP